MPPKKGTNPKQEIAKAEVNEDQDSGVRRSTRQRSATKRS